MVLKSIDAQMMKKMFIASAKAIDSKKEIINELNVFPVPDGDTGTNMTMTIMSAAREVNALAEPDIASLCKAISSGSLRGARGNSGVILSQLLRGFTKVIKDCNGITVEIAANAFTKAVETAYKAVMKPKEGTILTVAKGGAQRAMELVGETDDLIEFTREVIKHMEEVLDYTPELLPVLKEAGVVDSGGRGLVEIMKGVFDVMCGKEADYQLETVAAPAQTAQQPAEKRPVNTENISTADIKFGYCTEFIIILEKEFTDNDETALKAFLESIGDSIVCVADDEVVKIHVHTNDPGLAIQKALTYGQLTKLKIDNMREEHNEKLGLEQAAAAAGSSAASENSGAVSGSTDQAANTETPVKPVKSEVRKKFGFISVSIGEGVNEIFKGLGVDYLIEGGQTMNPSTEDMLNAIDAVNAETIFILPNNKNIILAADQAKAMTEDKQIIVIASKTIPQGIAALIGFVEGKSVEENESAMREAMKNIKTGQVTYSVRDTKIDGKEIRQGDYMGIDDHTIQSVGTDMIDCAVELAETMLDDDSSLVSIYYGADTTEEEALKIADRISGSHRFVDVEVHNGGQPVYYFILSVE
ncbi:MAG: DAK2 domain-containing protein [Lachnospiraceae bacterium]|nr:DAK2 domain-containing protein [Lachnospiraceae bacterium]